MFTRPPAANDRQERAYEPPAAEDGVRLLIDKIWRRGVPKADAARAAVPRSSLEQSWWQAIEHPRFNALGRRCLLAGGTATVLVFESGAGHPVWAEQPGDDEFLLLSKLVTGRADLDAETGRRMNAALIATHQNFATQVSACASFARARGFATVEPLAAALDAENQPLAALLRAIVSAWFLGVAGDGPHTTVFAWRESLMFDIVSAVLDAPSYCRAAPNYWTAKPPLS